MANHIVLPPQKLLKVPPSVREGISPEVELEQRVYGCHLIQKAGILLKLEAVSIASAQTILHRFFFRRSLKQFDVRRVATAALLLACKLEEDPHRVMHLIGVIHLLSQMEDCPEKALTEDNLDDFLIAFDSQEYELFRMDVFRCERYILRELGFMVSQTLVHPHRYILQYIHALFKGNFVPTSQLSQRAWGYLNDSMRTTLCCEVQPAVIAVGSIFLAACDLGIPLPKETGWHELFDVSWEDVAKVCDAILSLYTRPLPSYVKLAEPLKPSKPSLVAHSASKVPPPEASSSASGVAAATRQQLQQQQILSNVAGGVSSSEGKAEDGKETDTGRSKNEDDPGRSGAETRHANAGRDGEPVKKWLIYEGPERSEARERASDRGTETGKSGGGDHVRPSEARRGDNETSRTEHSSGTKSCGFSSAPRNAGFSGGERQAASGSGVSTEDSGRVKGAEHREDDSSSRRGDRRGPDASHSSARRSSRERSHQRRTDGGSRHRERPHGSRRGESGGRDRWSERERGDRDDDRRSHTESHSGSSSAHPRESDHRDHGSSSRRREGESGGASGSSSNYQKKRRSRSWSRERTPRHAYKRPNPPAQSATGSSGSRGGTHRPDRDGDGRGNHRDRDGGRGSGRSYA
ncbi:putative cyclin 4 [Toxoplasma gondii RUB]|uniref:Putative cyclin 4 n=3 Tax=Toxoplasma gondii TaxID=5811 RepID=A0A2G8Y3J6_TOXGO|nr:putative cyclin 4 [Toxoplasma gondii RUB]KFH01333.1 putative cyclin 4 [Toxoplasma gondii VAND]PIM01846.1 putative cyclin 4 [Toxoplasma gondii COUG]